MQISFEPWLVFNAQNIKQLLLDDPNKLYEKLESMRKAVMEAVDYRWSNSHEHMWTPNRQRLLSILLLKDLRGIVTFHVYDEQRRVVCSASTKGNWEDSVNSAFTRIAKLEGGTRHCSDCDQPMQEEKIAGRYFGGIYCTNCWEATWKEVEANESYN